jgi:hypothetical protein
MSLLKYLLMFLGVGLFGSAGSLVVYDIYISEQLRRLLARSKTSEPGAGISTVSSTGISKPRPFGPIRRKLAQRLAIAAVLPILLALSIVVIPGGTAGVRVGQIWAAQRGTLCPRVHFEKAVTFSDSEDCVAKTRSTFAAEKDRRQAGMSVLQVPLAKTPVSGSERIAGKEERL